MAYLHGDVYIYQDDDSFHIWAENGKDHIKDSVWAQGRKNIAGVRIPEKKIKEFIKTYIDEENREVAIGWTEFNLLSSLRETRDQNAGIPLTRVAEIIKEVFDEAEIEYLTKLLNDEAFLAHSHYGPMVNHDEFICQICGKIINATRKEIR